MRSLRARLVVVLLALSAVGLVVLGAVTYLEQRSFLLDRVDQQLRAATPPVSAALDGAPPPGEREDHEEEREEREGGPGFGLPAGTYGERRAAGGAVVATTVVAGYEGDSADRPRLPRDLPAGRIVSVGGGDGRDYRVLALADPDTGATDVVALPLGDVHETLERLLAVEAVVIAAVLLVLGLLARSVVRVGLLPLERMGRTADAIAGGDLSHRVEPADRRSEVGRLGLALNAMLARLERAFAAQQASEERLRRFLADASHELRTPLASIRGYAELFRMGAAREPDEAERSMRRIEQEAARMGVLVDDLLALARLEQPRQPERAPVDLAALARDAVADARAAAPGRTIGLDAPAPAMVEGDAHQLAQVLANLLANALAHTPGGTPVEVSATGGPGSARLTVRDHGPGLPPGEPSALFERFWRAEGGRTRGRAGAGLGLAIVAEIAARHGGRVEAANAPGGGASFTVTLPLLRG